MSDAKRAWVRFRNVPDDLIESMPTHVRAAFVAARRHRFDIELLCPGVRVPSDQRSSRRFVLVADDLGELEAGGPLSFDLHALAEDVRAAVRLFIISTTRDSEIYAAIYASAVEDLANGHDVALVIETRPALARVWARTLAAMQHGGISMPRTEGRRIGLPDRHGRPWRVRVPDG